MPPQYFTPTYITYEDIEWQLQEKIKIGDGTNGTFSTDQLNDLCAKAERKVEQDMSERYLTPFQTKSFEPFINLSDNTRAIIVDLCVSYSLYLVLVKFFGSSSNIKGDLYWRVNLSTYKVALASYLKKNEVGLFHSSTLTDLAIDPLKFTGQDALPPALMSNPMGCRNYAILAARRLTNPVSYPARGRRVVPTDVKP